MGFSGVRLIVQRRGEDGFGGFAFWKPSDGKVGRAVGGGEIASQLVMGTLSGPSARVCVGGPTGFFGFEKVLRGKFFPFLFCIFSGFKSFNFFPVRFQFFPVLYFFHFYFSHTKL